MARRIKGINVEIGGDTRPLAKALKDIDKTSEDLQSELKDVNKLLKFDPRNTELLAQKQELLTNEIENTTKRLKMLEDAEKDVQEQFEKGKVSAEVYRNFQRELQDTRATLKMTENSLAGLTKEQERVENATKTLNTLFQVAEGTIEDYANVIGDKLVSSINDGTASSRDIQKAIDKIGKVAIGSEGDINDLRTELKKIEKGEASVNEVKESLKKLGDEANDAEKDVEGLGDKLKGLAGGAVAGIGAGAAIEKSLDLAALDTKIDIVFNVPEESKAQVKGAIKDIEAYGVDTQAALEGVRRQWALNADAGDDANERIVKGAAAIATAYDGIDFTELIQEANEIGAELGISNEEALGLAASLIDTGFPPEQLDIISEYGSQLKDAGYTAEEIQGVFAAGIETKTWNIDNLLDGLKEGRIKLEEFGMGIDDATADMIMGTNISSQQLQQWGEDVSEGGEKGKEAMRQVAEALVNVQDETKRNELGVLFFGTMWEEQGTKITDTILNADKHTGNLAANTQKVSDTVAGVESDPLVMLNTALNDMLIALTPLLEPIANVVGKLAEWMQNNPELTSTIVAIVGAIGIFLGIVMAVTPVIMSLVGAAGALGLGVGALLSPFTIVIAIIAAIIAIGVALWLNWDTIKKKAGDLAKKIREKFNEFKKAISDKMTEAWEKIKEIWGKVQGFFEDIDLKEIGKDIIQGLIDGITSMGRKVKKAAQNIANGIGDKVKEILKLGSPSRVLRKDGKDAGEGLRLGLLDSVKGVGNAAGKLATTVTSSFKNVAANGLGKAANDLAIAVQAEFGQFTRQNLHKDPIIKYFNAIREDGDYLNDWLTHITHADKGKILEYGKQLAPYLEGQKQFTVNMYSPKALDVREANVQFKRTLNKMALQW